MKKLMMACLVVVFFLGSVGSASGTSDALRISSRKPVKLSLWLNLPTGHTVLSPADPGVPGQYLEFPLREVIP